VIEFESVTGQGVKATIRCQSKTHALLIGNAPFATRSSPTDPEEALRCIPTSLVNYEQQETKLGRTVIYISLVAPKKANQPQLVLAVSLADAPKPSSRHAIRALENMGIEVNMMTGDSKTTALAVAKQVGIRPEGVWAAMSPKGKASMITELMEKHSGGVAMVCPSNPLFGSKCLTLDFLAGRRWY
jgi:Cu+-exporting ATPase